MALPTQFAQYTLVVASPQKPQFFNVFYYKPSGTPEFTNNDLGDSDTLGEAIRVKLTTHLDGVLTTSSHEIGGRCVMHRNGQPWASTQAATDFAGEIGLDECPSYVAVVMQKRTATPGRSGRGRWFVGPVPEALTDENRLTDTGESAYAQVLFDWTSPVNALGVDWIPQLLSVKNQELHPITAYELNIKLGVLRGRQLKSIL